VQPTRQAAKGRGGSDFDIYSRPATPMVRIDLIKTKTAAKEENLFFQTVVLSIVKR